MPCRALEAFRRVVTPEEMPPMPDEVLMPCRALEAFRPKSRHAAELPYPGS